MRRGSFPTQGGFSALLFFAAMLAMLAALRPAAAEDATDAALNGFALDIDRTCRSAAEGFLARPALLVDPLGSTRYGAALVKETDPKAQPDTVYLCIYTRAGKDVEFIDLSGYGIAFAPTK